LRENSLRAKKGEKIQSKEKIEFQKFSIFGNVCKNKKLGFTNERTNLEKLKLVYFCEEQNYTEP
jgi:hypothetical protein